MASDSHTGDLERLIDTLLAGGESENNDARALFLIASGASTGSHKDAHRHGLNSASASRRAVTRLKTSAGWSCAVASAGGSSILCAEWLRRENPVAAASLPAPAAPRRPAATRTPNHIHDQRPRATITPARLDNTNPYERWIPRG